MSPVMMVHNVQKTAQEDMQCEGTRNKTVFACQAEREMQAPMLLRVQKLPHVATRQSFGICI